MLGRNLFSLGFLTKDIKRLPPFAIGPWSLLLEDFLDTFGIRHCHFRCQTCDLATLVQPLWHLAGLGTIMGLRAQEQTLRDPGFDFWNVSGSHFGNCSATFAWNKKKHETSNFLFGIYKHNISQTWCRFFLYYSRCPGVSKDSNNCCLGSGTRPQVPKS